MKVTYQAAGVDVHEGQAAVKLMKKSVEATYSKHVLTALGSFSGLYELPSGYTQPVLVSGTDGVGTKLLLLQELNHLNTVGQDLVAMCVNDIICQGAKPMFFLDYLATGKLVASEVALIVDSIARACQAVDCSLIGGETAEMPGLYAPGELDLAGFAVGIVDKPNIITGSDIHEGDVLIGLTSSGFHSNGYSLIRKLFLELYPEKLSDYGDRFAQPTTLYVKPVLRVMEEVTIKGLAHITGGGFFENIPRMLPKGLSFDIDTTSWQADPMFHEVCELASLRQEEAFSTFNMGIGMVMALDASDASKVIEILKHEGQDAAVIGTVVRADVGILR